jgi:hypothetical protein
MTREAKLTTSLHYNGPDKHPKTKLPSQIAANGLFSYYPPRGMVARG